MSDWAAIGLLPLFAPRMAPPAQAPFRRTPPGSYPPPGYRQPLQYGGYIPPGGPSRMGAYSGKATTAFVLSLVGLACFGFILGIIAIVMANNALKMMKQTGDDKGKGLAMAALVIGIVDLIGWVIFMAVRLR